MKRLRALPGDFRFPFSGPGAAGWLVLRFGFGCFRILS